MGGDSSKHTGGDFNQAQKDRAVNQQTEDLPLIPFDKKQSITDELTRLLKNSIWLANFKRAYRGYLRRKPERTQQGTMLKIHHSSLADADALGYGHKDTYATLLKNMTARLGSLWSDDAKEFLTDRGKLNKNMSEDEVQQVTDRAIMAVFKHMADTMVQNAGKKLYEKYSRGADFEASDVEVDADTKRKLLEEREEKLRLAAAERERQAAEWQAAAEIERKQQEAREAEVERRRQEQANMRNQQLL